MTKKPSTLIALLLAALLAACAAPAPQGTLDHASAERVSGEHTGSGYASEGSSQSAAVPAARESEAPATNTQAGQDYPEPRETEVVSDRTRTSMEGALVGALVGGLAGGFGFGGTEAALIGAAIGAGAGFLVADQIAKRKEEYATEEEFLDSEIQMAADFNRSAAAYNEQLRTEIAALNRSADELLRQYGEGLVAIDAIDERREAIQQKIEEADQVREDLLEEYEIKLAVYNEQKEKRAQTDEYLASLAKELNQLDQNIQSLKNGSLELAQIEDKLTV